MSHAYLATNKAAVSSPPAAGDRLSQQLVGPMSPEERARLVVAEARRRCLTWPDLETALAAALQQAVSDALETSTARRSRKIGLGDARAIRRRLAEGERASDLAREYGVSSALVSQIRHGEVWRG